jgi:UDP-N-acetyl-D-galactosamine dehydrogenase
MYQALLDQKARLAVVGLGYVGLPIALAFARKLQVLGFDIHAGRVAQMQMGIDPSKELPSSAFEGCNITFSADPASLREAQFFVVAVPTPIDEHNIPNLRPLLSACEIVGRALKPGDCVVFESTVYPGCTEEDCLPILEALSGLRAGVDFHYGYSPERINPGDKERTIEKIIKVVSGDKPESLELIAKVYELIIEAGVHRASSVKVAEAAKIIENTQRDLNIALMNELSLIFAKMGIPTHEVLEAAGTKWNFLKFFPGLVGGHCIGVDPYYLTYKAQQLGYNPQVILSGRRINDGMAEYVAQRCVQALLKQGKDLKTARVLLLGITFKENVSDIRNSKVADVVKSLQEYFLPVDLCDPYAEAEEVETEYGLHLSPMPQTGSYDAIVVAVPHQEYQRLSLNDYQALAAPNCVFVDLKSLYTHWQFPSDWLVWRL